MIKDKVIPKKDEERIVVAKFGKTQGVSGKISVVSFFSEKKDILRYKKFYVDKMKEINLEFEKINKKIFCTINKLNNIEDVTKYVGKLIYIDRKLFPELEINQFYFNDLLNLRVFLKQKKLGTVSDVKNHGAGDYLEIKTKKKEILVPLKNDHVLEISLKQKKIFLNPKYYEV
ncbi:MAG: ribosome maturation factor RimM [Pseudomonadota bacterium]|nr:ribosome maturation factor RimM [Pseudomonadota bacterium]